MPHYSGITTNLTQRKAEHQANHPNLRNWKVVRGRKPFTSRADAQAWEDRQPGEHHGGGGSASGSWYGYSFDY